MTDAIRSGVIRVNEGCWFDPVEPGEDGRLCACDINTRTPDLGTSRLGQSNCGHTVIGDVELYDGDLPALRVFAAPENG